MIFNRRSVWKWALPALLLLPINAASQTGPTAVAAPEGFGVRSADGDFALRVRGGLHLDSRFFVDDPNETLTNQFELRRARLDLQATAFQDFDFRLHTEVTNSRLETLDVYGNIRLAPELQLRAGKMKSPVGLERLQSSWVIPFAERGYPSALLPNRDVGAQVHGVVGGGTAEYAVGIFNGVPDGASADLDTGDSKDLNARLAITPFRTTGFAPLQGLTVGIGVTTGEQNGSAASPLLSSYRSNGRDVIFRFRADGTPTGTAFATDRRFRLAPQAAWYWRNFYAIGEYTEVEQTVRIGDTTADLTNSAWQVAASIMITGEPTAGRSINPKRVFDREDGGWGAVELAGRVSGLDIDEATFPTFANPAQAVEGAISYTGGINWYLNRVVKLVLNYEQTEFTTPAGGVDRPTEKVVIGRLQFAI